ncbi:MAG: twin-arginine translocase TatA/TatE family subunit [Chloroflexota bacterium]
MPFNLGGPELIIVLVIVLIVFGAGKLPSVMKDVGKGVKEFKKAQTEEEAAAQSTAQSTQAPPPPATTTSATPNGSTTAARSSEPAPRA